MSVSPLSPAPVHVVVMGVSATGKTEVGARMAKALGFEFLEGDSFHPRSNIERMEAGIPLTDRDRQPWLRALADVLAERHAEGISTVLTCSALKRSYRDVLRGPLPVLYFVHLHASFAVLVPRMQERTKHFMPTALLESQFETLEPLGVDEDGVEVDVTPSIDFVVRTAVNAVRTRFGLEG